MDGNDSKGVLLDVGGGIGAIQWWFLNNGGQRTIGVDASSGYTALAQKHATENGLKEKAQFIVGDFTDKAQEIPEVNHITLDKVICCYPDYKAILSLAVDKSTDTITLSYPMDGIIADLFRGMMVLRMKVSGNPFKPFIHRVSDVRAFLDNKGFELKERELSFPWHIESYTKRNK